MAPVKEKRRHVKREPPPFCMLCCQKEPITGGELPHVVKKMHRECTKLTDEQFRYQYREARKRYDKKMNSLSGKTNHFFTFLSCSQPKIFRY